MLRWIFLLKRTLTDSVVEPFNVAILTWRGCRGEQKPCRHSKRETPVNMNRQITPVVSYTHFSRSSSLVAWNGSYRHVTGECEIYFSFAPGFHSSSRAERVRKAQKWCLMFSGPRWRVWACSSMWCDSCILLAIIYGAHWSW